MVSDAPKGRDIIEPILNSYSQVFFSTSKVLAVFLVTISFFDYGAGIGGMVAVLTASILAWGLGYNKYMLRSGLYGFNALLVGLGIGLFYQPSFQVFVFVAISSLLCFFLTVALQGVMGKYGLSYLSVPFLITIWMVALSAGSLSALDLSERGIFVYNELYSLGGKYFVDFYDFLEKNIGSSFIRIYFLSLGAIFFQTHLFAGIVISLGLLVYSRINFVLSVLGYTVAYLFYRWAGIEFDSLGYTFIGFNYILTAIALGGYYLVPGRASFGWIIILLPVVVLITTSTQQIFQLFRISPYSLPFNAIVLMFLYALKLREKRPRYLVETPVQLGVPEKNLYLYSGNTSRFPSAYPVSASLPFYGEWKVSQGHNGMHTHKGAWRQAWDFVITDHEGQQYMHSGNVPEDYYCFGKPVLAPADGNVVEVIQSVHDNVIGDVNTKNNWGNTVVIKHSEYLYSKLSHLKYQSVKVKTGDRVSKGQFLGHCGNSGRSPYPHLHFQFQSTPYIGSYTLDYPFGHYLLKEESGYLLKTFDFPKQDQILANPSKNEALANALHFIPGRRLFISVEINSKEKKWKKMAGAYSWIAETDVYNHTYLHCEQTGGMAYLYNQGDMHFFTNFLGKKNTPLFWFYVMLYKVPFGFHSFSRIYDQIPVYLFFSGPIKWLQDFTAPIFIFLGAGYQLNMKDPGDILSSGKMLMDASITRKVTGRVMQSYKGRIEVNQTGEFEITIETGEAKMKMICRNELDSSY